MKVTNSILVLFLLWLAPMSVFGQQIKEDMVAINDGAAQFNQTAYDSDVLYYSILRLNGGHFVNKYLLVGVETKFYSERIDIRNYLKQRYSVYAQYYFNPENKWVFFSELSANYGAVDFSQESSSGRVNFWESKLWGLSVGLGFNRFLNKEVVVQGKLNFDNYHNIHDNRRNDYAMSLKLGVSSLINFNDTSSFSKAYTARGRKQLNANLTIIGDKYSPYYDDGVSFRANYAQFVLKGLLLGVSSEFSINRDDRLLTLYVYTQYIQKLHNKLYAHVRAQTGKTALIFWDGYTYGMSGGLDYFLTPHTMIEANLISYDKLFKIDTDHRSSAFSYGPKINLRYFLR
jgi:hypothetical protein